MNVELPSSLLRRRCVLLRGQINDEVAQQCIAQLLFLSSEASQQPATLYVDSPGGSVTASLAIIRTIDDLSCALATYCCGEAGGTAAAIIAHGRRGFRTAIPDARFAFSPTFGHPGRAYVEAELTQFDTLLPEIIAHDTDKHEAEVAALFTSHAELTSADALAFGLIDSISRAPITPRTA
jgi:ATP-dependent Clp protease, protease subunit